MSSLITIPPPFAGASTWLQQVHRNIAPRVDDFNAESAPHEELTLRLEVEGYLQLFHNESVRQQFVWDRNTANAEHQHGIGSHEFKHASERAMAMDRLVSQTKADLLANRIQIRKLEATSRLPFPDS